MTQWIDYLWGKTDREPQPERPDWHHLLCHLIDVGVAAEVLLADPRAAHWTGRLAAAFGSDVEALKRVLPFLIGLHDLGKASPGFQVKSEVHLSRLRAAGAPWPQRTPQPLRHDLELGRTFADTLEELEVLVPEVGLAGPFYQAVSHGICAHHGSFFKPGELNAAPEVPLAGDEECPWEAEWLRARGWLAAELRRLLDSPAEPLRCRPRNLSAVMLLLNGFTILCDWIGSDTHYFPPAGLPDFETYVERARGRAADAIQERSLLSYLRWEEEPTFAGLFPGRAPRSVQKALDVEALPVLPGQFLAIIEAPMGEGKTEAALLLACRAARQCGCAGFYFALPTVATSNQMYDRVQRLLQGIAGHGSVLVPVNGLMEFHPDVEAALRIRNTPPAYPEEQGVHFDSWYLPRKRSLLAAYGVGTVDQALLCALNTRHVGLRLLGLAGKVVIVDEVHAYDLYMSTILDTLVRWLRELGASVILLSATLPSSRREALLAAFAGDEAPGSRPTPAAAAPYPLISLAAPGGGSWALPSGDAARRMEVVLEVRSDGERCRVENARWLLEQVRGNGRAVWICNTVGEAQAVFRELERQTAGSPDAPELLLFHARFLQGDRRAREAEVLTRFGPPLLDESGSPQRSWNAPARATILVATQVVEQSLDLDFDLMVSQLAPVDLLLQRLGRLWRHSERTERGGVERPRFVLLEPAVRESGPEFGNTGYVYSNLILLRTLLCLRNRISHTPLALPEEIRELVEAVYPAEADTLPEAERATAVGLQPEWFRRALVRHQKEAQKQLDEARLRVLRDPLPSGAFYVAQNEPVEDVDAEGYLAMQTRLGRPSIRVCLLPAGGELERQARGRAELGRDRVKRLLDHTVSLASPALVGWVEERRAAADRRHFPPAFSAVNALRDVALLPLTEGRFRWPSGKRERGLRLDERLGIVYDRDEEDEDA